MHALQLGLQVDVTYRSCRVHARLRPRSRAPRGRNTCTRKMRLMHRRPSGCPMGRVTDVGFRTVAPRRNIMLECAAFNHYLIYRLRERRQDRDYPAKPGAARETVHHIKYNLIFSAQHNSPPHLSIIIPFGGTPTAAPRTSIHCRRRSYNDVIIASKSKPLGLLSR